MADAPPSAHLPPLYSPALLRLATQTGRWPPLAQPTHRVDVRAPLCGSRLTLDLAVTDGKIAAVGVDVAACVVGQAMATLFAAGALGRGRDAMITAHDAISAWLAGQGVEAGAVVPAGANDLDAMWPGLAVMAQLVDYPARHGAALLPFRAAKEALGGQ